MKKDKLNNEELPLRNIFREVFDNHKEATEEKDFDEFFSQLEETGYFNKTNKKPFFLYSLIILAVVGVITIYFLINTQDKNSNTNQTSSITELPLNNTEQQQLDSENSKDETAGFKTATNIKEKGINSESSVNSVIKDPYKVSSDNGSSNWKQPDEIIPLENKETAIKDTVQKQTIEINKAKHKDSVRIKYIMKVDTIKNIDSTNINKKKWSKLKGKK